MSITVEKKRHTLKNTVMAQPDKFIVFLGRTFSGHNHDYLMLKQEVPPESDWFADIKPTVSPLLTPIASHNLLLLPSLPGSIMYRQGNVRRRKMTPAWAQRREELLSDCLVSPDVFHQMLDRLG